MTTVIPAVGYVAAVFPFACVFGASWAWPVDTSKSKDLQGRPPPAIFIIVWTLICIVLTTLPLVAIATYKSKRTIVLIRLLVVIVSIGVGGGEMSMTDQKCFCCEFLFYQFYVLCTASR